MKLDTTGLGEIVHAKQVICNDQEMGVLAILSPDLDFELSVLQMDPHLEHGGCGLARRLALAAQSPFNERLANIYFRYHPRAHDTAVFLDEADARDWSLKGMPRTSLS